MLHGISRRAVLNTNQKLVWKLENLSLFEHFVSEHRLAGAMNRNVDGRRIMNDADQADKWHALDLSHQESIGTRWYEYRQCRYGGRRTSEV